MPLQQDCAKNGELVNGRSCPRKMHRTTGSHHHLGPKTDFREVLDKKAVRPAQDFLSDVSWRLVFQFFDFSNLGFF